MMLAGARAKSRLALCRGSARRFRPGCGRVDALHQVRSERAGDS